MEESFKKIAFAIIDLEQAHQKLKELVIQEKYILFDGGHAHDQEWETYVHPDYADLADKYHTLSGYLDVEGMEKELGHPLPSGAIVSF